MSAEIRARDREIYRLRREEKLSLAEIGQRFNLGERRVGEILTRERHALYNLPKPEARADLTSELQETVALLMDVVRRDGAPITAAGREGVEYVRDPETGEWAKDFSGRIAAANATAKVVERLAKMLGIDAPAETVSEQHITYELKGEATPDEL
jgi:transcriptional regulator with XRE-family HTH domain